MFSVLSCLFFEVAGFSLDLLPHTPMLTSLLRKPEPHILLCLVDFVLQHACSTPLVAEHPAGLRSHAAGPTPAGTCKK